MSHVRGHRFYFVLFCAVAGIAIPFVGGMVRSWGNSREVDAFLRDDRLFNLVIADHPELRERLHSTILGAYSSGEREKAVAAGRELLSSVFPRYLSKASNPALMNFTRTTLKTLQVMAAHDTGRCFKFMFPRPEESLILTKEEGRDEVMASMLTIVQSAREVPAAGVDQAAAEAFLAEAMAPLVEKYGDDLQILANTNNPNVDRAKVCAISIDLYAEVLKLPDDQAGAVLRFLFLSN